MGNIESSFGIPQGAPAVTVPNDAPQQALQFVLHSSESLSALSDADLQAYIKALGEHMVAANAQWERHGCMDARGERDRLWRAEQEALHERWKRPHLVEAMEQEKGLA